MLDIVEPINPPGSSRAPIGSFLVSLLLHAALVFALWCLVYGAGNRQTISLTAARTLSAGKVSHELISKVKLVQPLAVPREFAPAGSTVTKESLIAGSMEADMRSWHRDLEPAQVEFFGASAFGSQFVFLLDISYSMNARQGNRFSRARDELVRSVSNLRPGQSYYVFLFCWETKEMFYDPTPKYVRVASGHEQRLNDWLASTSLGPGTDPRRALALAQRMKPDAVFLLSDGRFNEPSWTRSDTGWVDRQGKLFEANVQDGVESFYQDTAIHTIAFENPLALAAMQDIASATDGSCRYIKTESHRPVNAERFLNALRRIDKKRHSESHLHQEYRTRLSYARELIEEGELVYAEYLVRPLRDAKRSAVANQALLQRVLTILDTELGEVRLEDFDPAPELGEILGTLTD